jgi:hypothetical protein
MHIQTNLRLLAMHGHHDMIVITALAVHCFSDALPTNKQTSASFAGPGPRSRSVSHTVIPLCM